MNKIFPYFIVAFLALVIGNYFFAPKEVYIENPCPLQQMGSCQIQYEGVVLDFGLSPLPINPLSPVEYTLQIRENSALKNQIKAVDLRLLGHDMTMQEELFFPLEYNPEAYQYQAKRVFPTCTEQLMTWRLYLTIHWHGGKKWKTTFDLSVQRK